MVRKLNINHYYRHAMHAEGYEAAALCIHYWPVVLGKVNF